MNAEADSVLDAEESREVSATDQALMTAITKAEIDQAVIRADARPRSVTKFRKECRELVCLDEHTADECIFALPRREKNEKGQWVTKFIEGPSVRMAEIIAYTWRNNRVGARVTDEGREFITAQGVYQDLERNTFVTFEVRRRITNKSGGRYNADMIQQTGNAACSIASRNAITRGVPKALWEPIYQEAQRVCAGDARTLVARRSEALQALTKLHVTPEMACTALGVSGIEDITVDHIAHLRGLHNAVRDGDLSIEQAFAPPADVSQPTSRADQAKEALRKGTVATPTGKKDEPKSEGKLPFYSMESAIAALRAEANKEGANMIELNALYAKVIEDFDSTGRPFPVEIEGAFGNLKALLEQKADK